MSHNMSPVIEFSIWQTGLLGDLLTMSGTSIIIGCDIFWRLGVMVNTVGRINEVNQCPARLVLIWVTILVG